MSLNLLQLCIFLLLCSFLFVFVIFFVCCCLGFFVCFEMCSHYVDQATLSHSQTPQILFAQMILMPFPPSGWEYKHTALYLAEDNCFCCGGDGGPGGSGFY